VSGPDPLLSLALREDELLEASRRMVVVECSTPVATDAGAAARLRAQRDVLRKAVSYAEALRAASAV
jgi:hypothetical protein